MRPTASRLRRGAAGISAAACLLALGACGTGFDAQTNQVYQPAAGANDHATDVDLLNVVGVDNSDDTATISASVLNKADADETITGVTGVTDSGDDVEGGKEVDITFAGPIDLPHGDLVKLGEEAEIVISYEDLGGGQYATLTFEFQNAAPVEMDVPIVSRGDEGVYDAVAEAPAQKSENPKS
ncbi:hypothetical protein MU582_19440 [Nocardioidaceae bacterium SCSIO 66511]|nr:hypothetical protein MU582_19440 [Nocardioidaceae bacterium SCSIO 66511]